MPANESVAAPFPAATVVLLRDRASGPEVLMIERVRRGSFAGFWVFPGGRVDPEDRDPADADEIATARRAAAREAVEETSLIVDPADLVVHSHWMPPPIEEKRFSTWFFVGRAPDGDVLLHEKEATRHEWFRPGDAIDAHAAGSLSLAPPTWMTLRSLMTGVTVDEVLGGIDQQRPGIFHTRALQATPMVLAWRGDVGYDSADPADPANGAFDLHTPGPRNRLFLAPGGWRYEISA